MIESIFFILNQQKRKEKDEKEIKELMCIEVEYMKEKRNVEQAL